MQGGVGLGRLFVHMYPVWLYEESLVTISIEFTVILYVRIIISEDPDYRLSHAVGPARCELRESKTDETMGIHGGKSGTRAESSHQRPPIKDLARH